MLDTLSYSQFLEFAKSHTHIAVHQEIVGDQLTPIRAFLALKEEMREGTLLESIVKDQHVGRYSFLGFSPLALFQSANGESTLEFQNKKIIYNESPLDALKICHQQCHGETDHPLRGFIGGLVGFISYNAIRLFEEIGCRHQDVQAPDLFFKGYQDMIAFDHIHEKVVIFTIANIKDSPEEAYQSALTRISKIQQKIVTFVPPQETPLNPTAANLNSHPVHEDLSDVEYKKIVEVAKSYIRQGDIFQVVLSRQFRKPLTTDPINLYRALRMLNPSPYMFYLSHNDMVITGASPEKLVSVKLRLVESCPLAGSRKRGTNEEKDQELMRDLLHNHKELAEHMMLVDLARNDIGAVADPGTVHVTELKNIKKFSTVMHISSTVQGQLKLEHNSLDALRATFPAGTLSGAPKIRAMEIIDELEHSARNIYGGGIVFLDNQCNLDSCIAIRTAFIKDGVVTVRAGAGIVADSDPQAEADETRQKAQSILQAMELAERFKVYENNAP